MTTKRLMRKVLSMIAVLICLFSLPVLAGGGANEVDGGGNDDTASERAPAND